MREKSHVEMGTQNQFELLDQRRLEIDRRDGLLFAFRIRFPLSAHILPITATLY